MNDKKFFEEINILRGFCVLLVVIGHVLTQSKTDKFIIDKTFQIVGIIIYSFHMHTFFFMSGFLSCKTLKYKFEEKEKYIRERGCRLMLPYFVMGIIYTPLKIILSAYSRIKFSVADIWKIFVGNNPDGALWFLYSLFIISTISCLIVTNKRLNYILGITLVLYILSFIYKSDAILLRSLLIYPFFFVLGIKVRLNYDWIKEIFSNKKYGMFALVCFVISCILVILTNISGFSAISTITGLFSALYLSKIVSTNKNRIYKIFSILAYYSMDIYIFSEPIKVFVRIILKLVNVPTIISVVIIMGSALILPIVISKLFVRKSKILKKAFLGL